MGKLIFTPGAETQMHVVIEVYVYMSRVQIIQLLFMLFIKLLLLLFLIT